MSIVKLTEPFAVRQMRKQVKESLQWFGEEVILFQMYHVSVERRQAPRCPNCYDDIYSNSVQAHCPECYGTGFEGGYKDKFRGWAMLTSDDVDEDRRRHGQFATVTGQVNFEGLPLLSENDLFARVLSWSQDHRPLEIEGIYRIDVVKWDSLRTGNVVGRRPANSVGQRSSYTRLDDANPFYQMLTDGTFDPQIPVPRYDGEQR